MKVHGFWILLFSTATKTNSTPPNLYLLKDGNYTHCLIAKETESSAVMLTTTDQLPVKSDHYPNDASFCKISTDPLCGRKLNNDVWTYDVSVNYDLNPIDDQRWEDLNFIKTRMRRFVNVYNVSEQEVDFNITLSVKIKQDAQIFLCDQMTPLNSNCYWFIIGGWEGKKGVVRKCSETSPVPQGEKGLPDKNSECGDEPSVNYTTSPLNVNEWRDFVFTKTNHNYNVVKGAENILNYTDTYADSFKTKYVFVSSTEEYPGKWIINGYPKVYETGGPYNVQQFSNKVTQLTFSVLADNQSKLYVGLCENDNHSSCYKILIDHGQKACACTFNLIEIDKCKESITATKSQIVNFASDYKTLHHLTLKLENGKYTLLNNSHTLLEFHDTRIKPKQLLIGSNRVTAWNIQSYGLLTANTTGNIAINLNKGKKGESVCVAIFAQSCETCNLIIKLQDEYSRSLDTKTPSMKNTWEEIKLRTILENDTDLKLSIKLTTTNNGRAFIGDIRNCSQSARVLSTTASYNPPSSCTSLKFPKVTLEEYKMTVVVPSYNNESIDIFWLSEYNGAAKLQTELRYKGCDSSEEPSISDHDKNIVAGSLSKTNLRRIPYTSYNISFIDGNKNIYREVIDIDARNDFSHEEKNPTILVTQIDNRSIVNVSVNDCTKIQGPLYYFIQATCANEGCSDKKWENSSITQSSSNIELQNIFGQSNYKISIAFSRTSNSTNLDYKEFFPKKPDLLENDKYLRKLTWIFVALLVFCSFVGVIFYIYKKNIITSKPAWLHSVFGCLTSRRISEMEMATFSHMVQIEKLENYVIKGAQQLELQYKAVEGLPIQSCFVGNLKENEAKNRYKDIIAYDATRVIIRSLHNNETNVYINANYINGFNKEKAYIATQAPTTTTLCDFWRMIWQENVECIVMLCKLKENGEQKSVKYWPKLKFTNQCNDFQIRCTNITKYPNDYTTIRKLTLSRGLEQREITQIHYEGWLEKGVPVSVEGLRKILWRMEELQNNAKPILVHGCGGIGRTGTLILCDIAIKMAEATKVVDMFSILYHLRQQRMRMVETFEQYSYAHEVVMHISAPIYQEMQ